MNTLLLTHVFSCTYYDWLVTRVYFLFYIHLPLARFPSLIDDLSKDPIS